MTWGRKHKYGAVRTADGFPSKLERAVFETLRILEAAKEIKDIKRQQTVVLTDAHIRCKIDFSFINLKTGELEYAEAKGVEGERWRIIEALYRVYGPAPLTVWKGSYTKPYEHERIVPRGVK